MISVAVTAIERQRHRVAQGLAQRRERRQDRGAAGGVLHRDRDHVVDHQRHRRHLRDAWAEVLPGDHVRAARPGVDRHHLAVGQHHQGDAEQDHPGHRQQQRERRQAEERQQLVEDQLGAVVRGRDPVTRQHAEGQWLRQPLLGQLLVDQRRAEQAPLHRVPEGLREVASRASVKQASRLAQGHRFLPSVLGPDPGRHSGRAGHRGQRCRRTRCRALRRAPFAAPHRR